MVDILIVEDSPTQAEQLKMILTRHHHQVRHAVDAQAALVALEQALPDLIISDIIMPGMDGYQLCRHLKQCPTFKDIPVILLSALSNAEDVIRGLQCGGDNFIIKPCNEAFIISRINYILANRKHRQNENGHGVNIVFNDQQYAINSSRLQILDFLISTYEDALYKKQEMEKLNQELARTQMALEVANRKLTQQVQTQEIQLEKTQKQFIQQERLRALGEMAGGVAHDFNNALSSIMGFSDLLLMYPERMMEGETLAAYVENINTSAKDAARIVERLREFYRPRDADDFCHIVDINQVVKDAVFMTQPRWQAQAQEKGKTIQCITELGEVEILNGDPSELREILTNLIFNAVDAIAAQGTIRITTRCDADHVYLDIADTGSGMTENIRSRCLEPFFSTKGKSGTGLGLSMVYGIIKRHGGTIEVQSAVGQGTTFQIRLPIKPDEAEQLQQISGTTDHVQGLQILVVEDEALVRDVIKQFLSADQHTVQTAANGHEGLRIFETGRFDVVITDKAMPEMNGIELATALKQQQPDIPVILLTGFGSMLQDGGVKLEAVDYIASKPTTIKELRKAIAEVIQQH